MFSSSLRFVRRIRPNYYCRLPFISIFVMTIWLLVAPHTGKIIT